MKKFILLCLMMVGLSIFGQNAAVPVTSIPVAQALSEGAAPQGSNAIINLGGDLSGAATNAFISATNFAATQNTNFVSNTTNIIGITGAGSGAANGTYLQATTTTWTNYNNPSLNVSLSAGSFYVQSNSISLYYIGSIPGYASVVSGVSPTPFINYGRILNNNGQLIAGYINSTNLTFQLSQITNGLASTNYVASSTNGLVSTNGALPNTVYVYGLGWQTYTNGVGPTNGFPTNYTGVVYLPGQTNLNLWQLKAGLTIVTNLIYTNSSVVWTVVNNTAMLATNLLPLGGGGGGSGFATNYAGPLFLDASNAKTNIYGGQLSVLGSSVIEGGGHVQTGGSFGFDHAEGFNTLSTGGYGHAEGLNTTNNGESAHTEGAGTTAIAANSHAEGLNTITLGLEDHAEGNQCIASNQNSHAEGAGTFAAGFASHSEGANNMASNNYAHVEGYESSSMGQASHAEGLVDAAIGDASHAEGNDTIAYGQASHAEGFATFAGSYAFSGGQWSWATNNSFVWADGSQGSTVQYSPAQYSASFVVSNGFWVNGVRIDGAVNPGGTPPNAGIYSVNTNIVYAVGFGQPLANGIYTNAGAGTWTNMADNFFSISMYQGGSSAFYYWGINTNGGPMYYVAATNNLFYGTAQWLCQNQAYATTPGGFTYSPQLYNYSNVVVSSGVYSNVLITNSTFGGGVILSPAYVTNSSGNTANLYLGGSSSGGSVWDFNTTPSGLNLFSSGGSAMTLPGSVLVSGALTVSGGASIIGNGASITNLAASNIAPYSGPIPVGTLTAGVSNGYAGNLLVDLPNASSTATNRYLTSNGSGLTGITAAQASAVPTNLPVALPGVVAYWNAGALATAYTNGAYVASWPDLIGTNTLLATNVTFQPNVVGNQPGLQFYQGFNSAWASNATVFASNPTINSNCTMVIVWSAISTAKTAGNFGSLLSAYDGISSDTYHFSILCDTGPGQQVSHGCGMTINAQTNAYQFVDAGRQWGPQANVTIITWNSTNIFAWNNGRILLNGQTDPASGGSGQNGGIGFGGGFLGVGIPYIAKFNGYVAEILLATNAWNQATVEQANQYWCQKYGRTLNNVLFVGDSLTVGAYTTNGATFKDFVTEAYPGWEEEQSAAVGQNSAQMITNQAFWVNEKKPSQFNVVHLYDSGINEELAGYTTNQCMTNILNFCATAHSNNWLVVVGTLFSSVDTDGNNYRSSINGWLYNNWQGFCDGLADYNSVTTVGTNNAYLNTTYYNTDQIHLLASGMNLLSNVCVSAIGNLVQTKTAVGGIPASNLTGTITNTISVTGGGGVTASGASLGANGAGNVIAGATAQLNVGGKFVIWVDNTGQATPTISSGTGGPVQSFQAIATNFFLPYGLIILSNSIPSNFTAATNGAIGLRNDGTNGYLRWSLTGTTGFIDSPITGLTGIRSGFTNIASLATSQIVIFSTPMPSWIGTNYSVWLTFGTTLTGTATASVTAETTNGFTISLPAGITGGSGVQYGTQPFQ